MAKKKKDDSIYTFEPELRFSDNTIVEADGEYKKVVDIMKGDKALPPWCVSSEVTIIHPFGIANVELEFHNDSKVYIIGFSPSTKDYLLNCDVRCINIWCSDKGWSRPEPSEPIVRDLLDFWKHMWTVYQVDCDYLDKRYGKRKDEV